MFIIFISTIILFLILATVYIVMVKRSNKIKELENSVLDFKTDMLHLIDGSLSGSTLYRIVDMKFVYFGKQYHLKLRYNTRPKDLNLIQYLESDSCISFGVPLILNEVTDDYIDKNKCYNPQEFPSNIHGLNYPKIRNHAVTLLKLMALK